MKTGWAMLNKQVRISRCVFWPLFLALFGYLFFGPLVGGVHHTPAGILLEAVGR